MPEQTKKWFKPVGSEIQQTVPSFPLDALQITERLDKIESALVHPFETFQEIHRKLSGIEVLQRELVNDTLVRRQFRDEPISIGLTINYELKYHRHLYAYLYSNTAFTLLVSNGASLSIPANYWTNVSLPEGVYFSVSGGSDVLLQNAIVRTCDVPMNMATQQIGGVVSISGTVLATPSTTATLSSVASSAVSVPLLAANPNRKAASFVNDGTQTLFLAEAGTSSLTAYTVQIAPGGFYELFPSNYTGIISGIWNVANGNCRITENT